MLYGAFADFRDDDALEQSRDPLYGSPESSDWEDENGPYMRPWYVAINQLGKHGTIIVLDLKTRQLWMEDQEGGGTSDPGLRGMGEHRQVSKNRNAFDNVPSRRVDVVLEDLMRRFVTLEWVPGAITQGRVTTRGIPTKPSTSSMAGPTTSTAPPSTSRAKPSNTRSAYVTGLSSVPRR